MALPRLDVVFARRQKIFQELLLFHSQELLRGECLQGILDTLGILLPDVTRTVLTHSLLGDVGRALDRVLARELACRLAGNLGVLRQGRAVPRWTRQEAQERVPVVVCEVERRTRLPRNKPRTPGAYFTFEVQAGSPAGLSARQFWSARFLYRHARLLGFSKLLRPGKAPPEPRPGRKMLPYVPFEDPGQLFGMRLLAQLTPESCRTGLGFSSFSVPGSMLEHNRKLLRLRARIDDPCHLRLTHACHDCVQGADQCRAACHRRTYVAGSCPRCQRDSYFDPEREAGPCVQCLFLGDD